MKTATMALGWALAMTLGCATVPPQPLNLPPRNAPIEHRIAAYRGHAAMPHVTFSGWAMRLGDEELAQLGEVRPFLANAPEAEEQMHARDNQMAIGWTLFGVGMASMLSAVAVVPAYSDRGGSVSGEVTLPLTLLLLGAGLAVPAAFVMNAAQRRVPPAAEAYNRWLWNELDLPRAAPDGRVVGPTPHPALSPSPWAPQ